MMWGHGFNTGWIWLFGLLALVSVVLLVIVIVRVFAGGVTRDNARENADATQVRPGRSAARELLDQRYVKGELNTEEYREMLRVLGEEN